MSTEIASDNLKGRVFEVSLGDLNDDEDQAFRKIRCDLSCLFFLGACLTIAGRLVAEEIQGRNILTNFHGMSFTTGINLVASCVSWISVLRFRQTALPGAQVAFPH